MGNPNNRKCADCAYFCDDPEEDYIAEHVVPDKIDGAGLCCRTVALTGQERGDDITWDYDWCGEWRGADGATFLEDVKPEPTMLRLPPEAYKNTTKWVAYYREAMSRYNKAADMAEEFVKLIPYICQECHAVTYSDIGYPPCGRCGGVNVSKDAGDL